MNKVSKGAWWKEAVVYQIYPRSFMDSNGDGIGDLNGITQKLSYLKLLGIDVIWICPIFQSPNVDNGYDISDYTNIMHEFGSMDDFDTLLHKAHGLGIKVILDLVPNHTSDQHPWFIESRSSKDNPKRDWYIWRDKEDTNNWESIFEGSVWQYDELTDQYYLHLFSKEQPDLNWDNQDVREAMYDMIRWWLDKGIDGFRIDAISHMKKESDLTDMPNPKGLKHVPAWDKMMNVEGVLDYLDDMSRRTFNDYDIMTVGEANGVSVEQAEDWVAEKHNRLNMIFQFDHLHLWNSTTKKELDLVKLKEVFTRWQHGMQQSGGWNALFIENHDLVRVVSKWGDPEKYWYQSSTALGAMYFLMQGTPFIYQGQEIGMTNTKFSQIADFDCVNSKNQYKEMKGKGIADSEILQFLAQTSRDNSRTPMQWDDTVNSGFTSGNPWFPLNQNYQQINVAAQLDDPHSIFQFYRQMIQLRKMEPGLVYGEYRPILAKHKQIFAYLRSSERGNFIVICNISRTPAHYHYLDLKLSRSNMLLSNYADPGDEADELFSFDLRPYEARVYRCDINH